MTQGEAGLAGALGSFVLVVPTREPEGRLDGRRESDEIIVRASTLF